MEELYPIIALIVGLITGLVIWIYAISTWGLLIGLMLGWIPALIGGFVVGILWPLVVIGVIVLCFFIFK